MKLLTFYNVLIIIGFFTSCFHLIFNYFQNNIPEVKFALCGLAFFVYSYFIGKIMKKMEIQFKKLEK